MSLSVKYSGRSLNLPPIQSIFELLLSKASSVYTTDQVGGVNILQPTSLNSHVLLRCAVQAYPFPLHIKHDTL